MTRTRIPICGPPCQSLAPLVSALLPPTLHYRRRAEGVAEARDDKGRFIAGNPGEPGNPQARNVAAWRRALADSVSATDVSQVARKLMDAALAGEP